MQTDEMSQSPVGQMRILIDLVLASANVFPADLATSIRKGILVVRFWDYTQLRHAQGGPRRYGVNGIEIFFVI